MSFEADLYNFLSTDATIIAKVSTRIYNGIGKKDDTLPYITFQKISDPPHNAQDAAAAIANPTYQFNVWADNVEDREATSEALRNAMDGKTGAIGATSATKIRRMILQGQSHDLEEPTDGSQTPFFGSRMDVEIWYQRSVPTL